MNAPDLVGASALSPRRIWRRNSFWVLLSMAVMLLSTFGASLVQSSGLSVTVKNLTIEGASGRSFDALLLKPVAASANDKRPVIVTAHGWWNNKEMQDANYVELARRGYVVLSIDMYGHGNSDALPLGQEAVGGTGMYDAVKFVATLPYVDPSKIAVSGHSNGARAANFSVGLDNAAPKQLISAVYLVDNDPIYTDPTNPKSTSYINYYGNRDVGLQADQYDEFFFRSYGAQGQVLTNPRDYITTPNAQSFLNFGADPKGLSARQSFTYYTQDVNGQQVVRVINNPAQTHPWGPFSKQEVTSLLTFFNKVYGEPNQIAPTSQIWQLKAFFNALGLIAFAVFLTAFAKLLVGTRLGRAMRLEQPRQITAIPRGGRGWFWGGLAVSALFSGLSWWFLQTNTTLATLSFVPQPPLNPQGETFFIGIWAALNGLFLLLVMTLSWRLFGRKQGQRLRDTGALPGWRSFGFSVLIGLLTVIAGYALVFIFGWLFNTDFRFWTIAVKPFDVQFLIPFIIYLPLYALYYVASSVAVNCFNRFELRGREWLNTTLLALVAVLAPALLVIWQYVTFFATGALVPGFGGIFSIWLFPFIVLLPTAVVVSRKIYRVSNSPYIGGIIFGALSTLMAVSNTLTYTQ